MRRIGTLTDPDQAKRFADYLFTQSIQCAVEIDQGTADAPKSPPECDLWIRDEGHIEQAKQELTAFLQSPEDAKYNVTSDAEKKRREIAAEEKRKKKLVTQVQPKSVAGAGAMMDTPVRQQSIPVVIGVIIVSVIASVSTGFGRPLERPVPGQESTSISLFNTLSFVDYPLYAKTGDPLASIKAGEIWRLVTPLFLHGDTLHLAFNMLGIFFLGSAVEKLEGSAFFGMLLLISGLVGTFVQVSLPPESSLPEALAGLAGTPFSIGASGAVYGVFGYLWIRPLLSQDYPIDMVPANVYIMLGFLVFCIFFVDNIANGAHLGGLAAGVVLALVMSQLPSRFSDGQGT